MLIEAVKINPNGGSTTAVMAKIDGDRKKPVTLKTCNLGDSGYLIVRPSDDGVSTVFRSTEQQHYFNCPYQCGENHELPYKAFDNKHEL